MSWDNLVNTANKAEARANIQRNIYLDKWCPKGKGFLKISFNFRDDQINKKTLQAKDKPKQAKQDSKVKKFSNKARRKRKKKSCQGWCKRPGGSLAATTKANAQAREGQKNMIQGSQKAYLLG